MQHCQPYFPLQDDNCHEVTYLWQSEIGPYPEPDYAHKVAQSAQVSAELSVSPGMETWVLPKGTAYSFNCHISYGPIADACNDVLNLHQSGGSERFMDVYALSILSNIVSAPEQLFHLL